MSCAMKRIIGKKNMTRRWLAATISMLLLLCNSCAWFGTKPALNVGPDGRGCMVGVIDSTEAMILRVKNKAIKAGDVIATPYCMEQIGIDLHNEIYELTR